MNAKRFQSEKSSWLRIVIFTLAAASGIRAQTIYQTGFEAPNFLPDALAGQKGWLAESSVSQDAAQVIAISDGQELHISGALIGSTKPGVYDARFYRFLGDYNPRAAGTPIVDVSADLWLQRDQPPVNQPGNLLFSFSTIKTVTPTEQLELTRVASSSARIGQRQAKSSVRAKMFTALLSPSISGGSQRIHSG